MKWYMKYIILFVLFFLVFLLFNMVNTASAADIYVDDDGGKDYTTIQDAINNSNNGDTIYVWNGTYSQNVVVNKTINIVGNSTNNTFIYSDGGSSTGIFKIESDWVNISGLYFFGGNYDDTYGINITGNNITIFDCMIMNCTKDGITIENTQDIYLENLTIGYCNLYGGTGGYRNHYTGIYAGSVKELSIINTTFYKIFKQGSNFAHSMALEVNVADNLLVDGCAFYDNGNNFYCGAANIYADNVTIQNNYFSNNSRELILSYSNNFTIYNNTIIGRWVVEGNFRDYLSLSLYDVENGTIYNNTVTNFNGQAMKIYGGIKNSTIHNNSFYNNNHNAIEIQSSTYEIIDNLSICDNYLYNNTQTGIYLGIYNGVGRYYFGNIDITDNIIGYNNRGIYLDAMLVSNVDSFINISGNLISNNRDSGIYIYWDQEKDNIFRVYNNYFNNTVNVNDQSSKTYIWNATKTAGTNIIGGAYLGGNYWSDYTGVDNDADGLGDTLVPYNCSDNIASGGDYHPLTIFYPDPPYNATVLYNGNHQSLNFSWDQGNGSDQEIVVNCTEYWAWNPWMGTEEYNGTAQYYNASPIVHYYYYTVWSYNSSYGTYSLTPLEIHWGAMKIESWDENVTAQNETGQDLYNYTVFITNKAGTETYQNKNANNPTYISLQDVPYGDDTVFLISCDYYRSRTYYLNLALDTFYDFDFYLPPLAITVPNGSGDDGGNTSATKLYLLTVVGPQGEFTSEPIDDVKVTIKRYIEANDSYCFVTILYTDANGQCDVYLIPDNVYKITLEKEGYITAITDYIPSASIFTHTFRILPEFDDPVEYDSFSITVTGTLLANHSMLVTYDDSNSSTINWTMNIYEVYNGTWSLNATLSGTTNTYSYYLTGINLSRKHIIELYYNNSANFEPTYAPPLYTDIWAMNISVNTTSFDFEDRVEGIFGEFDLGWANVVAVALALAVLVSLGPYNVGAALIGAGASLGMMQVVFMMWFTNSFSALLVILIPVLIFLGVIYFMTKGEGEVSL